MRFIAQLTGAERGYSMPISVVVGGQYGSEGKGKVALELVRRDPTISLAIRPGGTNSGHTAYARDGARHVLRQLPAACIDGNVKAILPAGSYIDLGILAREIEELRLDPSQVRIDPRANIITRQHKEWEDKSALKQAIGSTGSGTGAAVIARAARMANGVPSTLMASECSELLPFVDDCAKIMSHAISSGKRILVEGTQGFGLSPLHGDAWPKATSRDTTASAFLSEAGLSPVDVDSIVLVLRAFPIRVAGDSGPLVGETSWEAIADQSGSPDKFEEFTSVTNALRRVAAFDPEVVRRAISINNPTSIVLNHIDQVDWGCRAELTDKANRFITNVSRSIGRTVDFIGCCPRSLSNFSPAAATTKNVGV